LNKEDKHKRDVLKRFKDKHVNANPASAREAATTSCKRNLKSNEMSSGKNTVLFHKPGAFSLFTDDTIHNDNCQSSFPDVWLCTNVKKDIAPADLDQCIADTEKYCRSCKSKFPSASRFEVEVDKATGHLYYRNAWYTDNHYRRRFTNYKLKRALDFEDCKF